MKTNCRLTASKCLLLAATVLLGCTGCGTSLSALSSGSTAPSIDASGWINGAPTDLDGNIVVLEMFATW